MSLEKHLREKLGGESGSGDTGFWMANKDRLGDNTLFYLIGLKLKQNDRKVQESLSAEGEDFTIYGLPRPCPSEEDVGALMTEYLAERGFVLDEQYSCPRRGHMEYYGADDRSVMATISTSPVWGTETSVVSVTMHVRDKKDYF